MLRLFRTSPNPDPKKRFKADPLLGLARSARAGDSAAIRTLIVSVTPALLSASRAILGARHPDVEDAAQEAAFGLVRALGEYREDCTVVHYAARIAALTALAHRRKLRARGDGLHQELDPELETSVDSPLHALAASHRRRILRQLCDELPGPQTEALILHCVLGMTVDEVAASSACPPNTVKSRLRLAKEALRARIESDPTLRELCGGDA